MTQNHSFGRMRNVVKTDNNPLSGYFSIWDEIPDDSYLTFFSVPGSINNIK